MTKKTPEVLQWDRQADDELAWRCPFGEEKEVRHGAALRVAPDQLALVVSEGQIADAFGPGMHRLDRESLPVLAGLKEWHKVNASPWQCDVYFFSTGLQAARPWHTTQPVTVYDRDFDAIALAASGSFSYRLTDARRFFGEMDHTHASCRRIHVEGALVDLLHTSLAHGLGLSSTPFLELASDRDAMARELEPELALAFQRHGFTLETLKIESLALPLELQQLLDQAAS